MSKAYVIKNKEGKYKTESVGVEIQSYFLKDIRCAEIFTDKEVAKSFCPSDCEVVEITIAEGDLEEENKILKRALELACEDLEDCADWAFECNGDDYVYDNFYCDGDIHDSTYFIKKAKGEKDE